MSRRIEDRASGKGQHTSSLSLSIVDVTKNFGGVAALKRTNLNVEAGELLSLLGPSGCGKTTTLRILAGFTAPDTGSVVIGDKDVTGLPPHKRELGMVFQSYGLFPHMTIGENIGFGLRMRKIDPARRTERIAEMLRMIGLAEVTQRYPSELSGGQQQRVALARALVTRPSILLLDEPLGALDKSLRERMQFEIRSLQRELGITTILVTHDQEEALTMSDRVAVMSAGEIVQIGSPSDIYERPRTRFVSEFLGTSNLFDATVAGDPAGGETRVRLPFGAGVEVPVHGATGARAGDRVTIAVRPEQIEIGTGPGIEATVLDRVFRGSYYAYELALDAHPATIFSYVQPRAELPAQGSRVSIGWDATKAVLLAD